MLVLNLANALALLFLQVTAYRRHRHKSFMLLTLSTIVALLSLVVLAIPLFAPDVRAWYAAIFITGTALYFFYAVLGVWGVASLFRSYDMLQQGV
jgi:hypothetical protein